MAVQFFDTRTLVQSATISTSTVKSIQTQGYAAVGDGGEALYKLVTAEPGHAGKVQSADGAWWELVETQYRPQQFGAFGDDSTNNATALTSWLEMDTLHLPVGTYLVNSALVATDRPLLIQGDGAGLDADGDVHGAWIKGVSGVVDLLTLQSSSPGSQNTTDIRQIVLRDFGLEHFGTGYALVFDNIIHSRVENLLIDCQATGANGIKFSNYAFFTKCDGVSVKSFTGIGILVEGDGTKHEFYGGQTSGLIGSTAGIETRRQGTRIVGGQHDANSLWAACVSATTENITLSGSQTVDGYSPSDGDLILVWQQTDASENGIYSYNSGGAWSRAATMDADNKITQYRATWVREGTTNSKKYFYLTTADPITLGTTNLTFSSADGLKSRGAAVRFRNVNSLSVKGGLAQGGLCEAGFGFDIDGDTHAFSYVTISDWRFTLGRGQNAVRFGRTRGSLLLNPKLNAPLGGTIAIFGANSTGCGVIGGYDACRANIIVESGATRPFIHCTERISYGERANLTTHTSVRTSCDYVDEVGPCFFTGTGWNKYWAFVNDDSVASFDLPHGGGTVVVKARNTIDAVLQASWRRNVSSSRNSVAMTIGSRTTLTTTSGTLTGTTGTDGDLTVRFDETKIYVENRLGSNENIYVTFDVLDAD